MKKWTTRKWLACVWLISTLLSLLMLLGVGIIAIPILGPTTITRPGRLVPQPFTPALLSTAGVILLLLVLVQALLLGVTAWFLQKSILTPLDAIGKASKQIEQGNLAFTLLPSSTREMAEVVNAFTAMGQALRDALAQREKLEEERRSSLSARSSTTYEPHFFLYVGIWKG